MVRLNPIPSMLATTNIRPAQSGNGGKERFECHV